LYWKSISKKKLNELKIVTCYFCHVKMSRTQFYLHINRHTEEKPFNCLHCSYWFSRPTVRNRHILIKHKINIHHKWNFCGVPKVTLDELNRHIQRIHTKDGKKFKCFFCKKEFLQKVPCSHMVMHTNEFHHKCKFCHAQNKSNQQLQYHCFKNHPERVDETKFKS